MEIRNINELNELSKDDVVKLIKQDPTILKYITRQTERMHLEALKNGLEDCSIIKHPSEKVQNKMLLKDATNIRFITNPSQEVQIKAIKKNADAIKYIKNPIESVKLMAVKKNPKNIRFIEKPSKLLRLTAIRCKLDNQIRITDDEINFVNDLDECEQIKLISYPYTQVLKLIRKPSKDLLIQAVGRKPETIYFFQDNESISESFKKELQLIAVQKNPDAIQYINNPCKKAQMFVAKNNIKSCRFIEEPCAELINYLESDEVIERYKIDKNKYLFITPMRIIECEYDSVWTYKTTIDGYSRKFNKEDFINWLNNEFININFNNSDIIVNIMKNHYLNIINYIDSLPIEL